MFRALRAPERWGWLLLMRTGSADFSQAMLVRWKRLQGGRSGSAGGMLVDAAGGTVETPEEADVFELCGVRWVDPIARQDGRAVRFNALPLERPGAVR